MAGMHPFNFVPLAHRGLIRLSGSDARPYLQGLISNDVSRVTVDRAVYAAFLTPQGKFLHDLFVFEMDGALYLDCEKDRLGDLLKRLRLYKLRSKVDIDDAGDDWIVFAIPPSTAMAAPNFDFSDATSGTAHRLPEGGIAFIDPRLAALGIRGALPAALAEGFAAAGTAAIALADYDRVRVALGVADGSRDIPVDKGVLLEYGFDELNGVDWDKGCYMGQELTARTRYRGLVRKRLLPVRVEGPLPAPGTPVVQGDAEVGEIRTGVEDRALVYLRLEALNRDIPLKAGDTVIVPAVPTWAHLPEQTDAE